VDFLLGYGHYVIVCFGGCGRKWSAWVGNFSDDWEARGRCVAIWFVFGWWGWGEVCVLVGFVWLLWLVWCFGFLGVDGTGVISVVCVCLWLWFLIVVGGRGESAWWVFICGIGFVCDCCTFCVICVCVFWFVFFICVCFGVGVLLGLCVGVFFVLGFNWVGLRYVVRLLLGEVFLGLLGWFCGVWYVVLLVLCVL